MIIDLILFKNTFLYGNSNWGVAVRSIKYINKCDVR